MADGCCLFFFSQPMVPSTFSARGQYPKIFEYYNDADRQRFRVLFGVGPMFILEILNGPKYLKSPVFSLLFVSPVTRD